MENTDFSDRLERERAHGQEILKMNEANWGWGTPAGAIRKKRRADFLSFEDWTPNDRASKKVLEVGCGTGTFTGFLSSNFTDLVCLDISDYLLKEAQTKLPSVKFKLGDIHRTEFPSDSFDIIVGCSVLHHLEWNIALKEMYRILRPGGVIRFSEPNLLNPQIYLQKNWKWLKKRMGDSPDEYAFTSFQIKESLGTSGFKNIKVEPFEFLHPATPVSLIGLVTKLETFLQRTFLKEIGGSLKISAQK